MKRKQMALSLAIVLALGTGTVFGAEKEMSGAFLNASTDATYDNKVSVTKVDGPGNVAAGQQGSRILSRVNTAVPVLSAIRTM